MVWHYSKDGLFSVRSAYHLAISMEDNPSSSSRADGETSWWRRVWQARVPNKVKVFVWRACVNALPTGLNLKKRISNLQVWGLVSLGVDFGGGSSLGVLPWIVAVSSQLDTQGLGLFLCVCWSIWWFRNRRAMEGEHGVVKINFDGAMFERVGEMGVGAVARDSRGHCLAWLTHRIPRPGVGEVAEAWAAREAIQLALRHGWCRVVFEGDCVSLIRKLVNQQRDLSIVGPLVSDILYFLFFLSI
ncbi:UNVERIFIED_CONTAM: hypothetical protein Sangu_0833700 [Sesamum angustifolium]|uniref:RNase H type-1 domain-containing protein n=1 Tax=Sesamum angustifolium TaxID=2727405 RepID=A0AAW2PWS2_9LAMI